LCFANKVQVAKHNLVYFAACCSVYSHQCAIPHCRLFLRVTINLRPQLHLRLLPRISQRIRTPLSSFTAYQFVNALVSTNFIVLPPTQCRSLRTSIQCTPSCPCSHLQCYPKTNCCLCKFQSNICALVHKSVLYCLTCACHIQ